jgi:hypothetical protein
LQKSGGIKQFVGSINNGPIFNMSYDNSTTGDKQSIITRQEDANDVVKGALRASGLLDFTTKETNESSSSSSIASSITGEETTDIDDSWLSDLMVINTAVAGNNVVDKQALIEQRHGSILTPRCHDNYNDIPSATSLLDKYLSQKNVQNQQELQQQQSGDMDNEQFDSYFNELFPELAL